MSAFVDGRVTAVKGGVPGGNRRIMNHNTPLPPRPLHVPPADVHGRFLTTAQLRARGVTAAETTERCGPGGPWQQLLPGVFLLHPGRPTVEERLHAALTYASREALPRVPSQPEPGGAPRAAYPEAMLTGLAALKLRGFAAAPPLAALDRVDVLVPRLRRIRSTGFVRVVRTAALPAPGRAAGLPVAPVPRALADAVARLTDPTDVRGLLTEAVRARHCDPASVVRELTRARLLNRPHVVDAVDSLLAEGRALAEDRLYRLVRDHRLPDPLWDVELRLPGGPGLGGVDAYWPEHAVAVELDARGRRHEDDPQWAEWVRRRERLERLGVTVVRVTPKRLRESPHEQAAVLRTALMASADREPAAYLVVLPRQ